MGGWLSDIFSTSYRSPVTAISDDMWDRIFASASQKPIDPFEQFDDVDLMMELIKRGYAVHLPLENADKLK